MSRDTKQNSPMSRSGNTFLWEELVRVFGWALYSDYQGLSSSMRIWFARRGDPMWERYRRFSKKWSLGSSSTGQLDHRVLYTLRQQSGWDSLAIHGLSSIFSMECLHIDCLVAMFPLPQGRDLALISLV